MFQKVTFELRRDEEKVPGDDIWKDGSRQKNQKVKALIQE